MNKEVIQIQIAWFFSNVYNGRFEDFSSKLKDKFDSDISTQQLPVHPDAPAEIPRLILSYPNFNLNVSKNRLDLFLKDIKSSKEVIFRINNVIIKDLSLSVGRIGFVKTFFVSGNIADLKKLLNEQKINKLNLKEINIRVNESKRISDYECNNLESLNIGSMVRKEANGLEKEESGILMVRDVNTLAEELDKNKFTEEVIINLINIFDEESNKSLIYQKE